MASFSPAVAATSCHLKVNATTIADFATTASQSWISQLQGDPEQTLRAPNKKSRQVKQGHYVLVEPTKLPQPELLAVTTEVGSLIGFPENGYQSDEFLRFFSGDQSAIPHFKSWATPYALSIYGQQIYSNCPFGNGNGYGDGRAISITEVVNTSTQTRWEVQLKGAGTTPFCRGADGRAVLRSSVREFLASEFMHNAGIPTTRALCLIRSITETTQRPWYSESDSDSVDEVVTADDPRIRHFPESERPTIAQMVTDKIRAAREMGTLQPDIMITEQCAIATRVAPSFLRVGHIELFARRARKDPNSEMARQELRMIVEHALFREFGGPEPAPFGAKDDPELQSRIIDMMKTCSIRIATLTAEWIRVGFCQGNFNSDNCLVAGRTMDYGPFGFIEKYRANWNMWVGGGEHFSFRNQPYAGAKNFLSLAESVELLLDEAGREEVRALAEDHERLATLAVLDVFRRKLGLQETSTSLMSLVDRITEAMETTQADYTIFWRQIATVVENQLADLDVQSDGKTWRSRLNIDSIFFDLTGSFYCKETDQLKNLLFEVLADWLTILREEVVWWKKSEEKAVAARSSAGSSSSPKDKGHVDVDTNARVYEIALGMRRVSPKYIPREWMLIEAYRDAAMTPNAPKLKRLQTLFSRPYDEQHQHEEEFYRTTPEKHRGKGVLYACPAPVSATTIPIIYAALSFVYRCIRFLRCLIFVFVIHQRFDECQIFNVNRIYGVGIFSV